MKRFRILYIVHTSLMGGASVALINIIKNLPDKIDVAVVYPSPGPLSQECERLGAKSYFFPFTMNLWISKNRFFLKRPYLLLKNIYYNRIAEHKLEIIVNQYKPHLIHTNVGPIDIGYKVAKKMNIPHVWHVREYLDKDFDMHPFPSMKSQIKKYTDVNNFSIAITKGIFGYFHLKDENAITIYDGVLPQTAHKCVQKKNYILFVGRLQDAKGTKLIIQAFVKYALHHKKFELFLAGDSVSSYLDECKALIPSSLTDRVKFLGYRSDAYNLMSHAAALVVASRCEGFGFITAEAMYNHCLVIGKNTAGTKEQFDNGYNITGNKIGIPFDNCTQLTEELCKLETDDYSEIVERAYHVVRKLYSASKQVAEIYKVYSMLLTKTK